MPKTPNMAKESTSSFSAAEGFTFAGAMMPCPTVDSVVIVTDVPGVVRELYVEAGYPVTPGKLVALIDES